MNFLLNMNVPRAVAGVLAAHGHRARHAGDVGLAKASDTAVVEDARRCGEVIITHDLDYGHLLAFSGERTPSVIILRLARPDPQDVASSIINALDEIIPALSQGAIVILEDSTMRVRHLPIERGSGAGVNT